MRQGCTSYVTIAIQYLYGQHCERGKAEICWWGGDELGKIQLSLLANDLMLVTERDEDANRSGNDKMEHKL